MQITHNRLIFSFIFMFLLSFLSQPAIQEMADAKISVFRGVKIVCKNEKKMFPKYWVNSYQTSATELDDGEVERSQEIFKNALEQYPEKLLKQTLSKVFVVGKLRFSGITAGGTYYYNRLYLANGGLPMGYTNKYLTQSFHHEYSSVLLNKFNDRFDREAWNKANPNSFEYGGSGTEAVRNNEDSLELNSELAELGFICQYGQSDLEEDFNTITARLFTADDEFWKCYDRYERLRTKIDLVIDFYQSIDKTFNKAFFRKAKTINQSS